MKPIFIEEAEIKLSMPINKRDMPVTLPKNFDVKPKNVEMLEKRSKKKGFK